MHEKRESTALAYTILFLGVLSTSSGALFVRLAQGQGAGSLQVAAFRMLFASLLLLPVILWKYRSEITHIPGRVWRYALLAGLFLSIHFATWISSLEYTSIASSVVLVSTTPIWVCLFMTVVKKQRPSKAILLGLGLSIIGGVIVSFSEVCHWGATGLICGETGSQPLLGNLLALIGGLMAAGYLLAGKQVRTEIRLTEYIFLVYSTAAILLVGTCLVLGRNLAATPASAFPWLICVAVIPQLIGHTTYNYSQKHFSTVFVSIALQGEPVGSTLLGVIFLSEIPSFVKIVGGIIILGGIILVSWVQEE
jgi:drug/metabolite transporter (DMT)-like permease